MKVLIVDDEINIQKILSDIIRDNGWDVSVASDTEKAEEILKNEFIDIVLLDVFLRTETEGIEFLKRVRTSFDYPPEVIVITGHGNVDMAVEALKNNAYDFIEKPPSIERLILSIKHAWESIRAKRSKLYIKEEETPIIGHSKHLKKILSLVESVAPTNGNVLITGESGVGKELIARSIHLNSKRKDNYYTVVNSAAIPEDLLESELFGYEKGAFTNAVKMKRGKFEIASSGTLFLDEIADMSLKNQSKILRAIQEKKIERLGGESPINVDVRLIAATNKNIEELVKKEKFREDLYFRLNVIRLDIKPLRERREDILPIFKFYIERYSEENGKVINRIEDDVLEYVQRSDWQGNIRELKNFAERSVIFSKNGRIGLEMLNFENKIIGDDIRSFNDAKRDFEINYIKKALSKNNYNVSKTAKMLGLDRGNLFKKMNNLGIKIENGKDSG